MSVDEMWEESRGKVLSITECVPEAEPNISGKIDNYNMPWYSSSLKRASKGRRRSNPRLKIRHGLHLTIFLILIT